MPSLAQSQGGPASPGTVRKKLMANFVYFMSFMFSLMKLPKPTPLQKLFADILQKNPSRRLILMVYRGFGKTTIANLFLLWLIWKNPEMQQAIWGQNEDFARSSVSQILKWVETFSMFAEIRPRHKDKASGDGFDTPQKPTHVKGASVNALSIGGAITGSRADVLLMDDPETAHNGYTQQRRENLDRTTSEAVAVIKQDVGRIIVLGTAHFDRSLYIRLKAKGYKLFILPAAVPPEQVAKACWQHYPIQIRQAIQAGQVDDPLDRFGPESIHMWKQEGAAYYERQFLLNIYRSKTNEKALDISRIILYDANSSRLPESFEHARELQYVDTSMQEFSCANVGEHLYRPFKVADTTLKYDYKVAYVDPSGQGKDETVCIVAGVSGGYMVVFKIMGLAGGMSRDNIDTIIGTAIEFKCDEIAVESNLSTAPDWIRAVLEEQYLKLYSQRELPMVIPIHNQISKNLRIEALDPIINSGRMIVTPDAIRCDYESAAERGVESWNDCTLTSQISNFSTTSDLPFDDRVDALAGACKRLGPYLQITAKTRVEDKKFNQLKEYLEMPVTPGETVTLNPLNAIKSEHRFRNQSLRGFRNAG